MKAKLFYSSFEAGLLSACADRLTRLPGKLPMFAAQTPAGALRFFFELNPKSAGMPGWPGSFRPVIEAAGLRDNARDDGAVSWYQFADEAMLEAMREQQRSVYEKVAAQAQVANKDAGPDEAKLAAFMRGSLTTCLNMMRADLAHPFEPRLPHAQLYYLDEADAQRWGALLGAGLDTWLARWCAAPETLEAYMWRVHWKDLPRA